MSVRSWASLAGLCGVTVSVVLVLTGAASAQTLSNSFGGLSESSKDPIDIESDVLVVHDAKKYATFKGNVKAVQGTTTLRASELDVHYVGGAEDLAGGAEKDGDAKAQPASTPAAQPQGNAVAKSADPKAVDPKAGDAKAGAATTGDKADDPSSKITKIEARGEVIINSKDDQTTTSDWALYDVPARTVTVGGNVVLTQGQNVLKGDRLVINLETGESRFENTGGVTPGKRIRALFMPKDDGGSKPKSDSKPEGAAPSGEQGAAKPDETGSGSEKPNAKSADDAESKDPWVLLPGVHE
ncbi:MAG: LptA/OstA family protein [Methyloceanibacter sp.]|uniref:LptA/OstA family protein n=1 Tax=Methyloceanibacter sp. TaxID=1965321 RepID=UPI003D9B3A87